MASLKEQWPWSPAFLRLFLLAPSGVGVLLAAASYPVGGMQAMWFLLGIPIGVGLRLMFGTAGRKVQYLKQKYESDDGEVLESLMAIGKTESPGLAILRDSELELVPIVGDGVTIPLEKLRVFKEGRMLPGKYVWGKRAFILSPYKLRRVSFAIAQSRAESWSTRFQKS